MTLKGPILQPTSQQKPDLGTAETSPGPRRRETYMSPEGRWPLGQWILCEPVVTVTRTLRLPARVPVKKQQHAHTKN